jgi:hypothetical protein
MESVARAKVDFSEGAAGQLRDALGMWTQVDEFCRSSGFDIPAIEPHLAINELTQRCRRVEAEIEAQSRRLEALSDEAGILADDPQITKYAAMLGERDRRSKEMRRQFPKMCRDAYDLNPDLDGAMKTSFQRDMERRAQSGWRQLTDPRRAGQLHETIEESIISLVPNLAAQGEVACMDPLTIDEVEETAKLMSDTHFTLSNNDLNAPFHVLGSIAQILGISFAVTETQKDDWQKSADFAMSHDTLTDSSIIFLGSRCREHRRKAISIHLPVYFDELVANPEKTRRQVRDVQVKLGAAHGVEPKDIVIFRVTKGAVHYTVR